MQFLTSSLLSGPQTISSQISHKNFMRYKMNTRDEIEYPEFPTPLYGLIDEYWGDQSGKRLTYLSSNPIPDLPLDILRLIGQYQLPSTEKDLVVLFSLDPTGKILPSVFKTKDPERIEALIKIISLSESSLTHMYYKLNYALEYNYYPVVIRLYYKIKELGIIPQTTLDKIIKIVQREGDYRAAINTNSINKAPVDSILRWLREAIDNKNEKSADFIFSSGRPELSVGHLLEMFRDYIERDDLEGSHYILNLILNGINYSSREETKELRNIAVELRKKGWNDLATKIEKFSEEQKKRIERRDEEEKRIETEEEDDN